MKFALAIAMALQPPMACLAVAGNGQTINVEIDKAKLVRLPKGSHTIIQGQPIVVRITKLPGGDSAVLTGTSFGRTNMIVLDANGAVQMDATVRVDPSSDTGVVVHRGLERSSYYDCGHRCESRLQLGDTSQDAKDISSQIQSRESGGNSEARKPNSTAGAGGSL
jgi:Flp pilus assembly secretin CpaC